MHELDLETAAKNMLAHLSASKKSLKPLYLQPDRAVFLAEHLHIVLKVYSKSKVLESEYATAQRAAAIGVPIPRLFAFEAGPPAVLAMEFINGSPLSSRYPLAAKEAGTYLQCFHALEANPPFSGGQDRWEEFISWWSNAELEKVKRLAVFDLQQIRALQKPFETLRPLLVQRPVVLLHGDLQTNHLLVDPHTGKLLAFLDFADAQPGDPLMDIAIASLWDHDLAALLLAGYSGIAWNDETRQLLTLYRLLRHIAEIPWLLERGFQELAKKDIAEIKRLLEHK